MRSSIRRRARPVSRNNGKSVRELGLTYRPLEETVVDFFHQLIDAGAFER